MICITKKKQSSGGSSVWAGQTAAHTKISGAHVVGKGVEMRNIKF